MTKTFKTILGLILAWALVAQAGIVIAQSPNITSMHTAATATGNGTALVVSGQAGNPANTIGAAGVQIANSTGTFTITFETLTSGSTWTAVMATNMTDDVRATTATAAGQYTILLGGAVQLRARISACSSCNVTVVGRLVPGLVARVASGGGGGGSGTVTSVGWTGGIVSVATATTTPAFTIAGTSGGIPFFDSATSWATSAALAANSLVKGGGAGAAPSTITTGTGVLTALGVNTGSAGAFVVNGGALGTPSSGTLTSATGLPISTGVSGLGTGVATFLATPSSANLATALTDETGSGAAVFGTSPDFTTGATIGSVAIPTISSTNTFTNKTLTASSNVLGGVTMTLGSDADGDTYYRASGVLTRLAKGTAGQCFQMNGGATAPTWGSCGGASGITIGTTTVTSGTAARLIYETAGNVVGEISGATSNGTNVTFGSGNLLAASPVFTTDITTPIVKSAAGADLAANATAPAATTGASQVGKAVSITASAAVASTDTAGAAAGGSVTITAGAAARLTSGNANGGNINLVTGAGIGTGTQGQVLIGAGNGSATVPSLANSSNPNTGMFFSGGNTVGLTANGTQVFSGTALQFSVTVAATRIGSGSNIVTFTTPAAASLVQGAANSATPVANLFTIGESSRGGTDTNVAGANGTIQAGLGTGTGGGGSLIFRTGTPGSTGTTANSYATALTINAAGHLIVTGTAPTIASGFGTSPSIAGADHAGRVTVGTGGVATTGAITFGQAFATAPACTVNNETTVLLAQATATTTTLTITSATPFGAADKLTYVCLGY